MKHVCREVLFCSCSLMADEPDENCSIHGINLQPPRCHYCGRFIKREIKSPTIENNPSDKKGNK